MTLLHILRRWAATALALALLAPAAASAQTLKVDEALSLWDRVASAESELRRIRDELEIFQPDLPYCSPLQRRQDGAFVDGRKSRADGIAEAIAGARPRLIQAVKSDGKVRAALDRHIPEGVSRVDDPDLWNRINGHLSAIRREHAAKRQAIDGAKTQACPPGAQAARAGGEGGGGGGQPKPRPQPAADPLAGLPLAVPAADLGEPQLKLPFCSAEQKQAEYRRLLHLAEAAAIEAREIDAARLDLKRARPTLRDPKAIARLDRAIAGYDALLVKVDARQARIAELRQSAYAQPVIDCRLSGALTGPMTSDAPGALSALGAARGANPATARRIAEAGFSPAGVEVLTGPGGALYDGSEAQRAVDGRLGEAGRTQRTRGDGRGAVTLTRPQAPAAPPPPAAEPEPSRPGHTLADPARPPENPLDVLFGSGLPFGLPADPGPLPAEAPPPPAPKPEPPAAAIPLPPGIGELLFGDPAEGLVPIDPPAGEPTLRYMGEDKSQADPEARHPSVMSQVQPLAAPREPVVFTAYTRSPGPPLPAGAAGEGMRQVTPAPLVFTGQGAPAPRPSLAGALGEAMSTK